MASAFDRVVGSLDYPMVVVTGQSDDGERAGCLVGFHTQCSIDPPRYLVCVSKLNRTFSVASAADVLAVHFPAASDRAVAELFGSETGDEVDKFSRCAWSDGPGGAPVLSDVGRWFAGRVVERVDLGDHVGLVLDPFDGACPDSPGPLLTFQSVRDMPPGHPA